jgi:hypothetical protein
MYTGWAATPHAAHFPPNYALEVKAHEMGSALTYAYPGYTNPRGLGGPAYELPLDLALRQIDTLHAFTNNNVDEDAATKLWYRLLNCGFRLPISAGMDATLNLVNSYISGGARVYVRVGPKLSYQGWIEGCRHGRSFATNGSLVEL